MFAVLCLWVFGMGCVLVFASTSTGRALGVTLVSGLAFGLWVVVRSLAARGRDR